MDSQYDVGAWCEAGESAIAESEEEIGIIMSRAECMTNECPLMGDGMTEWQLQRDCKIRNTSVDSDSSSCSDFGCGVSNVGSEPEFLKQIKTHQHHKIQLELFEESPIERCRGLLDKMTMKETIVSGLGPLLAQKPLPVEPTRSFLELHNFKLPTAEENNELRKKLTSLKLEIEEKEGLLDLSLDLRPCPSIYEEDTKPTPMMLPEKKDATVQTDINVARAHKSRPEDREDKVLVKFANLDLAKCCKSKDWRKIPEINPPKPELDYAGHPPIFEAESQPCQSPGQQQQGPKVISYRDALLFKHN